MSITTVNVSYFTIMLQAPRTNQAGLNLISVPVFADDSGGTAAATTGERFNAVAYKSAALTGRFN